MQHERLPLLCAALLVVSPALAAASEAEPEPDHYRFVGDPRTDMEAGAIDVHSAEHLLLRSLDKADESLLKDAPFAVQVPLRALRGAVVDFIVIFQETLFVHEAVGHPDRTREAGGRGGIVKNWPIIPNREPLNSRARTAAWTATDEELAVAGGYEANQALALAVEKDMYSRGWAYYHETVAAAINRVQTPFGAYVRDSANPNDAQTYLQPPEDTAEFAAAFQRARGKPLTTASGAPHPDLVKFYKDARTASLFTLLDPVLVESVWHIGGALATMKRERPLWMFPAGEARWMYGTQFNLTPMGYEFALNLFVKRGQGFGSGYVRYGRPLRDNGLGFELPRVVGWGRVGLGGGLDAWNQEGYGTGGSLHALATVHATDWLALTGRFGAKKSGYMMAQPIRSGGYGWGGLELDF